VIIAEDTIEQNITADLLFLSEEKGEFIRQITNEHRNIARLLSADNAISGFSNTENTESIRNHLVHQTEVTRGLLSILVLDENGIVRVSTDSPREGNNMSHFASFERGMRGAYIGSLHVSEGKKSHLASAPIRKKGGELLGVLIAEFDLRPVYEVASNATSLGKTGEFLLLEKEVQANICFNPKWSIFSIHGALPPVKENTDPEKEEVSPLSFLHDLGVMNVSGIDDMVEDAEASQSLCAMASSGQEGILRAKDENGTKVVAAHHYLSDIGLGLIAKVNEDEIYRPITLLISALSGTTALLILLIVFIALRLSHDVVRPIWKLRDSLEHLNAGHFVHKRSIFTGDELEVLDAEVKKLATRLEEAYSSLEHKVKERTQELAEQHSQDEALIESIGEGFLAVDLDGKVIACNQSAENLLRWEKGQIINGHFTSVLSIRGAGNKLIPPNEHLVQQVIDKKRPVRTFPTDSYECERRNGEKFPIAITAVPFMVGTEMRGIVVTFRDVSEEKRIDRMKSEFISLTSHQLRTPLTAIGWYTELIHNESDGLKPDQKEYVQQIVDSHRRMADLVNSLLNVSRIELGHLKIEPQEVNLKDLIESTLGELKPQMQNKNMELIEDVPENLNIKADKELLQIAIENLASNAVKYTPEGKAMRVKVEVEEDKFILTIKDDGMGIPKAQQHKVFEKLFRADNVVKSDTDGTGIGLYITKSIVEAWGGKIWFESDEDNGTSFHFNAPIEMRELNTEEGKRLDRGR